MDSSNSAFHPHIQDSFQWEEGTWREKYQHSDPHHLPTSPPLHFQRMVSTEAMRKWSGMDTKCQSPVIMSNRCGRFLNINTSLLLIAVFGCLHADSFTKGEEGNLVFFTSF